jgi:hypothetical protein
MNFLINISDLHRVFRLTLIYNPNSNCSDHMFGNDYTWAENYLGTYIQDFLRYTLA